MEITIASIKAGWTGIDLTRYLKKAGLLIRKILTFSLVEAGLPPKKIICIAFDGRGISAAHGWKVLNKTRIRGYKTYARQGAGPLPPDALASLAGTAVRNIKSAGAEIVLCIPNAWVLMRTAEFPASVGENLPGAVTSEIDRLTPFQQNSAYYDYMELPARPGKIHILLSAAKTDLIDPYLDALRKRGLQVSRIIPELVCTGAILARNHKNQKLVYAAPGNGGFDGLLIEGGAIAHYFSRRLPKRSDVSAGEGERELEGEIKKEIAALFPPDKGVPEPRILIRAENGRDELSGRAGSSGAPGIHPDMTTVLSASDAEAFHAAAGGVLESLRPAGKGHDLLRRGKRSEAAAPVALSAVLLLVLLVTGILQALAPLQMDRDRLAQTDRQTAMRKDEVKKTEMLSREIAALKKEIGTIHDFKEGRAAALDILKELTSILPKNVWLSRVRLTDSSVDLEGYTEGSAAEVMPRLEGSGFFRKAEFASPTFRDIRMNAERFAVKMELRGSEPIQTNRKKEQKAGR